MNEEDIFFLNEKTWPKNPTSRKEFGGKLSVLRKEKNLTVKDLSIKSNVSEQTISNIEKGKMAPRKVTLDRIFKVLK